jgi:hypothetical protein
MAKAKTKTLSKAAPKPPSRKPEDKEQYERFREFAREHGANNDPEAFDRASKALLRSRPARA